MLITLRAVLFNAVFYLSSAIIGLAVFPFAERISLRKKHALENR